MQVEEIFDFDCAAEVVMRMFGNEEYYRDKYRRLGGPQPEFLDVQSNADRIVITMRHDLDTSAFALPAIARKRLGQRVTLKQTDSWQLAARTGRISIRAQGLPIAADMDLRLVEQETGARLILAFEVRAKLPMFASKVERAVADGLLQRMQTELAETARMTPDYK